MKFLNSLSSSCFYGFSAFWFSVYVVLFSSRFSESSLFGRRIARQEQISGGVAK